MRALQPWPGCYSGWRGKRLKIIEAVPLTGRGKLEAGRVGTLPPDSAPLKVAFVVGTGAGILGVQEVQAEGGRVMSATEFLRGQRHLIGEILR